MSHLNWPHCQTRWKWLGITLFDGAERLINELLLAKWKQVFAPPGHSQFVMQYLQQDNLRVGPWMTDSELGCAKRKLRLEVEKNHSVFLQNRLQRSQLLNYEWCRRNRCELLCSPVIAIDVNHLRDVGLGRETCAKLEVWIFVAKIYSLDANKVAANEGVFERFFYIPRNTSC